MKFQIRSNYIPVILFIILAMSLLSVEAGTCRPTGKIAGERPPPKLCNKENDSDCCIQGKSYTIYKCSPPVSRWTKATLTINSFEESGHGGGPSECDNKFYSDNVPVVALSTGWFKNKQRCLNNITIYANGRKVNAMVIDECDSTRGCEAEHGFQPPCMNNIVDAPKAVWKPSGVRQKNWGQLDIYWSDA